MPVGMKRENGLPGLLQADGDLERSIVEMTYNPLVELADQLSGEAEVRKMEEGDAGPFLGRLIEFLGGVEHAVSGGLAMRTYLRERPTLDFDVLVSGAAWEAVKDFAGRENLDLISTAEDIYSYRIPGTKMEFDVLVARSPLWKDALAATIERTVFKKPVRVLKPDFLAAMKVNAYSERKGLPGGEADKQDIRRLIEKGLADEDALRDILRRHRPDLLPELDEVLRR